MSEQEKAPPTVFSLFTEADVERMQTRCQEIGQLWIIMFDEAVRISFDERTWAKYVKHQLGRLGLDDLAARINPAEFHEDERLVEQHRRLWSMGRSSQQATIATHTRDDLETS